MKSIYFKMLIAILIFLTNNLMAQKTNYLIICPDILYNSAIQLKEYRQSTGYTVSVTNLSAILNGQPNTTENIDTWIENYISTNDSLKYIVLFGNTDLIPTYYSEDSTYIKDPSVYINVPDNYVFDSDLLFSISNDSIYSNYIPSLAVGRIPVSNPEQASNYLNKIKNFETNNSKCNTILFYGQKQEMMHWLVERDGVIGDMQLAKNMGFDTISLMDATEDELFNILNSKPIKAVIFYGHGWYDTNYPLTYSNINKWDNIQNPVLFLSSGCSFNDNTTGTTPLGDSLTISSNGSVSSIGASIFGGYGSGWWLVDGFLQYFKGKSSIGILYNRALKYHYDMVQANQDIQWLKSVEEFRNYFTRRMNFIGDPGLIINSEILPLDTAEVYFHISRGEKYKGHSETGSFIEHFESFNGRDSILKTNLIVDNGSTIIDNKTILDIEGNIYHKVNIGTQIWMTENLKTTKYNDGTEIPYMPYEHAWDDNWKPISLNNKQGYWWYNNNIESNNTYGALYNWYTVNTGKLCPCGWHVPSRVEWITLIDYLGGIEVAGGKLKETGLAHWGFQSEGTTNSSGFTALPGGFFNPMYVNQFVNKGTYSYFSSSTQGIYITLISGEDGVTINRVGDSMGFSVRCIKDSNIPEALAIAGSDQFVNEGTMVTLDGSLSYNPKGNSLTYKWTAPIGITMDSMTSAKPTFTAPEVKNDSILSFYLSVNDGSENSAIDTVKITVLNVIKVGNFEVSAPVFKVYPNPTTGVLSLEFAQNFSKKTEVFVSNLVGAEVFRREMTAATKLQIDLSNQVSGIYLLKVIIDDQQFKSKIIIRKK